MTSSQLSSKWWPVLAGVIGRETFRVRVLGIRELMGVSVEHLGNSKHYSTVSLDFLSLRWRTLHPHGSLSGGFLHPHSHSGSERIRMQAEFHKVPRGGLVARGRPGTLEGKLDQLPKFRTWGYVGFRLCVHLPRGDLVYHFLSHSQILVPFMDPWFVWSG